MKIHLYPFDLRLSHTFRTSYSSKNTQPTLIVGLSDGVHTGYGEATSNPFYGTSVADMCASIKDKQKALEDFEWEEPHELYDAFCGVLSPFVLCCLDEAIYDLWAKRQYKPLYACLNVQPKSLISSYTIGLASAEKMISKIQEKPWPLYKIKMGTQDDIKRIQKLRQATDVPFRIDVNGGWTLKEAQTKIKYLEDLNIELVEQPLARDQYDAMRILKQETNIPLIADESCPQLKDIDKCIGAFDGINIKLTKGGGITPALRMITKAKKLSMKLMMGCMVESSVGISALAQLVPFLDYVDMDGALLISNDPATGVQVTPNGLVYAQRHGTGACLHHV